MNVKNVLLLCVNLLLFFSASAQNNKFTVLPLDGKWEIVYDDLDKSIEEKWYLDSNYSKLDKIKQIDVPSCWEEYEKNYEGTALYRRKVYIPKSWKDRKVNINFKASNYKTEVWLNDEVVGFHEGGYTPFSFRIDKLLKFGEENSIIVRVISPIILTDKRIDGLGRQEVPMWRGAITGGIWQSVSLSTSDFLSINDVFIEPIISSGEVSFNYDLENVTTQHSEADMKICLKDSEGNLIIENVKKVNLQPGITSGKVTYKIPDVRNWSMEDPYLYTVDIDLKKEDDVCDRWSYKFGMREFTVKDNTFYLNGKPLYLKATFYEGLYPTKLAYPDSYEMAVKEVMLAKEAGFNMIRPWRKPAPDMWLNICDSLGMMTVGSLVVECMKRPISTPRLSFLVENELQKTILSNRNRTCIVQWELFNEINRPILAQMLNTMSIKARDLDPTRMILDESGGWGAGANLYLPYERTPFKFNDIHHYSGSQITDLEYDSYLAIAKTNDEKKAQGLSKTNKIGKNVVEGIMSYLSEIGYGSTPDLEANINDFKKKGNSIVAPYIYHQNLHDGMKNALHKAGWDNIYPKLSDFYKEQQRVHGLANKRMIEAIRSNDMIKGYCVHALVDGDWVIGAGLLDLWRNPKTDVYELTKAASQNIIAPVRVIPRNIYQGEDALLDVKLVSEFDKLENCKVEIEIKSANGKKVFRWNEQLSAQRGINAIIKENFNTNALEGEYIVDVEVRDNGNKILTRNTQNFNVFKVEDAFPDMKVALIESDSKLKDYFTKKGVEVSSFTNKTDIGNIVLVGKANLKNERYVNDVENLMDFVNRGGKAIFLEVPGKMIPGFERKLLDVDEILNPFNIPMLPKWSTFAGWSARSHVVSDHPIFKGLPVNHIMYGLYENIHPFVSMCKVKGDYISGVIGYDHFPENKIMLRHYNGPGDVWWAATVLEKDFGKGLSIFSTLRLLENLGKDPVAEIILKNMLDYMNQK